MIFTPAYAKLNLALSVVGRRPDGRHDLRSVVVRLDWHDLVGAGPAEMGAFDGEGPSDVRLEISGPSSAEVPVADNLLIRAARAMLAGQPGGAVDLRLEKRLPAAAGLGGGSADAAAVLLLLGGLRVGEPAARPLRDSPTRWAATSRRAWRGAACWSAGPASASSRSPTLPSTSPSRSPGAVAPAATFAALTPGEWRGAGRPEALARLLAEGRPAGRRSSAAPISRPPRAAPTPGWPRPSRVYVPGCRGGAGISRAVAERSSPLADSPGEAEAIARDARDLGFPARACRTVGAAGISVPGQAPLSGTS